MAVHSAGILAYRYVDTKLEVLLVHPGGPFWAKKDIASWSIPKGIMEEGESLQETARREFKEETGVVIDGKLIELATIKQASQKIISAFTIELDVDITKFHSNTFEMEWPPKSGKMQEFPENDKAAWFKIELAKEKIFKGQRGFLEKLISLLKYEEDTEADMTQLTLFD